MKLLFVTTGQEGVLLEWEVVDIPQDVLDDGMTGDWLTDNGFMAKLGFMEGYTLMDKSEVELQLKELGAALAEL
jgi:hypothetical protein